MANFFYQMELCKLKSRAQSPFYCPNAYFWYPLLVKKHNCPRKLCPGLINGKQTKLGRVYHSKINA